METKKERLRRKNKERVSRFRLHKRLEKEIQGEGNFLSPDDTYEAKMDELMSELENIKSSCEIRNKPLWSSQRFHKWEDKLDKLINKGKKGRANRGEVVTVYIDPKVCSRCGYPKPSCICNKSKEENWLHSPPIKK